MRLARVFVAVIFFLLGLSFIASTASVLQEFGPDVGWMLVKSHSHLFVFFPTFGILALAAFYTPSVVFTHFYWTEVKPLGAVRFLFGFVVVIAASLGFAYLLERQYPRALWEISPDAHRTAFKRTVICADCKDAPALRLLSNMSDIAGKRVGFSKFSRVCQDDKLLETPEDFAKPRYCFASGTNLDRTACCSAQNTFKDAVTGVWSDRANGSRVAALDRFLLPLKCFFIGVVLAIGLLLALWRSRLERHYKRFIPNIERGVLIGAAAMLAWPLMDYANLEVVHLLFGRQSSIPEIKVSLAVAPWAFLLLFYFLKRLGKQVERYGQIAGAIGGVFAAFSFDAISDWSLRLLGAGATWWSAAGLVIFMITGFVALLWPRRGEPVPVLVNDLGGPVEL